MTLNKLRREVARYRQRARRAKIRLDKFRLKCALEGRDLTRLVPLFNSTWLEHNNLWSQVEHSVRKLQDARQDYQIKKLVDKTTRA